MTVGRCPNASRVAWPIKVGPVDFTCDGVKTALPGFLEWPALAFARGSVGGSGAALPDTEFRVR
jgi:hypothetical protein